MKLRRSAAICPILHTAAIPAVLLALALSAACDGEAGGSETRLEAVIDTVDGVERRTYPDSPAEPLAWSYDTTAVIGGFGLDNPEYQFGGLGAESLAGDDEGNLYVLDADGIRVLGYGADGTFLGSWGREGGGPGELGGGFGGGPRSMTLGPGDTLWINDRANQRLTFIPVAGDEPGSVSLPPSSQGIGGKLKVDESGLVSTLSSFSFTPDDADEGIPPRPLIRLPRTTFTDAAASDDPMDTLWVAPAPRSDLVQITTGGRRLMMMMSQRFAPAFFWERFGDGGLAVQQAAAYEVHLLDASGRPERIIRRDPPPRLTSEADRQRYLDSLLAPPEQETQFNTEELRRERAKATTFADSIPRVVGLRRDTQDRLWVGVSVETPNTIERIDVYDRDGRLLGELHDAPLPDHFFGDGRAAIIDRDELDVQRIHMLRVIEDPEALEMAEAR